MAKRDLVAVDETQSDMILYDNMAEPIDASEILRQAGLNAPRIKASDLVDRYFVIRYYRQFETAVNPEGYAYFAVVVPEDTGEMNTVVLGGKTVIEFLDACKAYNPKKQIRMMLGKETSSGGRSYYTIR